MQSPDREHYRLDLPAFRAALGTAIKERREELGLSKHALARAVDVAPSRIYEWENGLHIIRWDRLLPLCEALLITPTALVARAEQMARDTMRLTI
jgi:transcriptional regulator with XRE-family HTH domain